MSHLHTLALRQTDPRLLLSDNENVALSRREAVGNRVLDVYNVEPSVVTLPVSDHTHTTHVATTGHHRDDAGVELDVLLDLACSNIDLDCVVDFDGWVGVTNPAVSRPPASVFCRQCGTLARYGNMVGPAPSAALHPVLRSVLSPKLDPTTE